MLALVQMKWGLMDEKTGWGPLRVGVGLEEERLNISCSENSKGEKINLVQWLH